MTEFDMAVRAVLASKKWTGTSFAEGAQVLLRQVHSEPPASNATITAFIE